MTALSETNLDEQSHPAKQEVWEQNHLLSYACEILWLLKMLHSCIKVYDT